MKRVQVTFGLVLLAVLMSLPLSGIVLARTLMSKALLPGGDRVVQFVYSDSGVIYVGTEGGPGVCRSDNNGASWTDYGTGLGVNDVLAIVRRGDDLLAGTWGAGVYKRAASDSSWSSLNSELPSGVSNYIRTMAIGPGSTPYTYAAWQDDGRVFRLAWGSSTWEEISSNLPSQTTKDIVFVFVDDDGNLYAGLVDVGVYRYVSGNWQTMGDLGGRSARAMDSGPDDTLWVGTSDGVYHWTGTAWEAVSGTSGWHVRALKRNSLHPDELYAGVTTGAVYRYQQSTGGWSEVSNLDIPSGERVWSMDLATNEPQRLFVGAENGLYYADIVHPTATPTSTATPTNTPVPTNTPTVTPTPIPDLLLALTNDPLAAVPVSGGDYITYTVHYTNVSGTRLTSVRVWCYIPEQHVVFDTVDGDGQFVTDPDGDYVYWDVGRVQAAGSGSQWFRVQVEPIPPTPTNTATPTSTATPTYTPTMEPTLPGGARRIRSLPAASQRITNQGAYATWSVQSQPIRSNPVYNWIGGLPKVYLPLVMKSHQSS